MAQQRHGRGSDNMAEVAEFILDGQSFGINGSKIKQLVPWSEVSVTRPPYHHPAVNGVFMFRGHSVPLIDLNAYLDLNARQESDRQVVVVTEFNEMTSAFVADQVNQIHRKAWNEFKPLDRFLAARSPHVLGAITAEGRDILVLDLEHIVGEIFPATISNYDAEHFEDTPRLERRGEALVFFAEDSHIIRTSLVKVLGNLGYTDVQAFGNGALCLEAIEAAAKGKDEGARLPDLVISDIEMPQMDGLVLCQTVRKQMNLDIPFIMFSSLINEQVAGRCEAAGATGSVSKPQTTRLVELMDGICFGEGQG